MRIRVLRLLAPAWCLLPLVLAAPAAGGKAAPADSTASLVPDVARYFDTWLWVESEGVMATSSPETKGAARTLVLNPDFSYEFHQRRETTDSVLCRGQYNFSEESGEGREATDYLQFEGWFESYEHRMATDFVGPDTLLLIGDPCNNCPEHIFVRGRTAAFTATVARGDRFRHDLWEGLAFELEPTGGGWEICVRDSTRPAENLARLTQPGDLNALHRSRSFIFSREVGRKIPPADSSGDVAQEEDARMGQWGRGALDIEDMVLTPPKPGERAGIQSMRFKVAIEEVRRRAR